ncbi:hypothetical protein [Corynebacterium vitaeruminis]|uniref:hypothetical protein n=1 Tax=Corynebacterium vitaeruminis TaxID=38305 RepID=UPI0012DFBCD6|nr:hypothetical protein [Corynebacterium vitaeruminis]
MSISRDFDEYVAAKKISVRADVEEAGPCEIFETPAGENGAQDLEAVKQAVEEALRSS